jgi:hypothetical protein
LNWYAYYLVLFIFGFGSCAILRSDVSRQSTCKKESIKELKRWGKYLTPPSESGVYTYLYKEVKVPDAFETIFWERKIGRDYGLTVQVSDTTRMQFLQLALGLQNILYSDCIETISKSELEEYFGKPTFTTRSFLAHAKTSYNYSFNYPDGNSCYHGEYMGNVAYQACLTISMEIDSKDQVVELNTSSFEISAQ